MSKRRWFELRFIEQMANVGAEIGRTINWKKKKDKPSAQSAFYRALELLLLTKTDPKNKTRLKEVCRLNEMLVDWYLGNPEYSSSDADWEKYFYSFNFAARNYAQ